MSQVITLQLFFYFYKKFEKTGIYIAKKSHIFWIGLKFTWLNWPLFWTLTFWLGFTSLGYSQLDTSLTENDAIIGNAPVLDPEFGRSMVADENTLIIAAPNDGVDTEGIVYFYQRNPSGIWNLSNTLKPQEACLSNFGISLELSGNTLAIGSSLFLADDICPEARIYIYERSPANVWIPRDTIRVEGSSINFGSAISLQEDVLVCKDDNIYYIFRKSSSTNWLLEDTIELDSEDIKFLGDFEVVSSNEIWLGLTLEESINDRAFAYRYLREDGTWNMVEVLALESIGNRKVSEQVEEIEVSEDFAAIGIPKANIDITLPDEPGEEINGDDVGIVYIFRRDETGQWSQSDDIIAADPSENAFFGSPVIIQDNLLLIGSIGHSQGLGAAYLYYENNKGRTIILLKANARSLDDNLGSSIALSDTDVFLGVPGYQSHRGAAYLYSLSIPSPSIQGSNNLTIEDTMTYTTSFVENNSYHWLLKVGGETILEDSSSNMIEIKGEDFKNVLAEDSTLLLLIQETSSIGICEQDSLFIKVEAIPPDTMQVLPLEVRIRKLNNAPCLEANEVIQQTLVAQGDSIETYLWTKEGDNDQILSEDSLLIITEPGIYQVAVSGAKRSGISSIEITENDLAQAQGNSYYLPTLFSPNGDGRNDFFLLRSLNVNAIQAIDLKVFDREGAIIYQSNQVEELNQTGWDGKDSAGREYPNGTYVYKAKIDFKECGSIVKRGRITLIR